MCRLFVKWMDFYGKSYGEYELLTGDFLDPRFEDVIHSATYVVVTITLPHFFILYRVIFCNNFAFGPSLNHQLKLKFQNLRDGELYLGPVLAIWHVCVYPLGVKIFSSREFCPLNFRITERNLSGTHYTSG